VVTWMVHDLSPCWVDLISSWFYNQKVIFTLSGL
jgi:hypothetical protein